MKMAKPIVKWAGGKARLLPELLARVPTEIRTYAEPFAGGAALFFALARDPSRSFRRAVLADQNEDLVACYRAIRDDVESLIVALGAYRYDKELFYATREKDPRRMSDVERGARLIFLNHTCFNGLWRVNSKGKFNVPFGRYTNPRILDEAGLRAASALLQRARIVKSDFAAVTRELSAGDFVYLDPPYVPLSKTASFTAYASDGFGPEDQSRLRAQLVELKARGVFVMVSNADTPETRELYRGFAMHVVRAGRVINADVSKRGDTTELLVVSWDKPGLYGAARERRRVAAR